MENESFHIIWKYRDHFYRQNEEGRFVETPPIEGWQIFEVTTEETIDPLLDFAHKYQRAYASYQSEKARSYRQEILTSLRLLPSKSDVLPTLRKSYEDILGKFKGSQYWRSIMDQTPMSMARRFAREDTSESWIEFYVKLIDRASRTEDAYCYWLILRWLKFKIAHHEASTTGNLPPLVKPASASPNQRPDNHNRLLMHKAQIRAHVVSSFDELFKNPADTQLAVRVLYEVTSRNNRPVIDDTGYWIGKKGSKSVLIAWVEVLRQRGKFKMMLSDLQVSELLNSYFPGLSLDMKDTSLWRKRPDCQGQYHADFLHLIR